MLKVGIIGVGSMGTQHFLRLMNKIHGATVTAVSDINEAHAKEVIALYPTVRFIADPIALINDPEVDAVVIVSIDSTHEEYCLEAIKCGKYIFCVAAGLSANPPLSSFCAFVLVCALSTIYL